MGTLSPSVIASEAKQSHACFRSRNGYAIDNQSLKSYTINMADGPGSMEQNGSQFPVFDTDPKGLGFTLASFVPVATQHGREGRFEIFGGDHQSHEIDAAMAEKYRKEFEARMANASEEERTRILALLQQIQSEEFINESAF